MLTFLLLACSGPPDSKTPVPIPLEAAEMAPMPPLTTLTGERMPNLDGKVVLFVNVASECGFTPQYEALQSLYQDKHDEGLEIVGVPCNQFGGQEPGEPAEIATFCKANYGVTFPLLEKQDVNGGARSQLYDWLITSPAGSNADVEWNFEKFLVGRDGRVISRYNSAVKPDDPVLRHDIERAL